MSDYKYSKIKNVEVKNFRSITDVKVGFEESPIVCLTGNNDSGKTSLGLAVSVLAGHKNPRDQKSYIREGTSGFGIKLTLEDGHEITRVKSDTMNGYLVTKDGVTEYQTGKIGEGLPVQVAELMGITEESETGEYLQFRTYEDKLLFAYTSASSNYKIVYGALKVEQLTKAISNGNKDVNTLKEERRNLDIAMGTVIGQIRGITVVDTSSIEKIVERIDALQANKKYISELINILEQLRHVEERIPDTAGLEEITKIEELNALYSMKLQLSKSKQQVTGEDELHTIDDMGQLTEIGKLIDLRDNIRDIDVTTDGLDEIRGTENLYELEKIMAVYRGYKEKESVLNELETKQQELEEENKKIIEELKENGIKIVSCPNCGHSIPFKDEEALG